MEYGIYSDVCPTALLLEPNCLGQQFCQNLEINVLRLWGEIFRRKGIVSGDFTVLFPG